MSNVNNTIEYIVENAVNPKDFILKCEEKYENKIIKIAKDIAESDKTEIVMLAGPSSSGKTTTALRENSSQSEKTRCAFGGLGSPVIPQGYISALI